MGSKYTAVENSWFVRRATAALAELLLRPNPILKRKLARRAKGSRDGVCGLNLTARDMRRFWPKVRQTATCWEWQGFVMPNGYGRFRVGDDIRLAHRVAYEFFKGEVPEGLTLDHLCFNRRCVNPDHLEAVTQAENNHRGRARLEDAA